MPLLTHPLLDRIKSEFELKNDAAISRFLDLTPPFVSRLRSGKHKITPAVILQIYDKTGWSIEKIRECCKEN